MRGGETISCLEVPTPKGEWGEKGWMAVGRKKLAVPKQHDRTASGALDWGFPHSGETGVEKWRRRVRKEDEGERKGVEVCDP